MSTLGNTVFDEGLDVLNTTTGKAEALHICSAEPANHAAVAGVDLGNDNGNLVIPAPSERGGGGREVIVAAISGGDVTGTGTAAFYAIVDDTNSDLLATGPITPTQAVTSGNTFSLTSVTIGIPDPA
jgi:hypothetical protein